MKKFIIVALALYCISFPARGQSVPTKGQSIDTAGLDFRAFAERIAQSEQGNYNKAKAILNWVSNQLNWLATDYKQRTTKEILARGGGNCFELAKVYMDLIRGLQINYRSIAEINIQPCSDRRQLGAEERIRVSGNRASVFGQCHNDHRWVEIYDVDNDLWQPVDPSVNVIGVEQWLKARVWFGERKTPDTSITNTMIVPFAIFVKDNSSFAVGESRSGYYLVEAFNKMYDNKLQKLASWEKWKSLIEGIGEHAKNSFDGKQNLHEYAATIKEIAAVYSQLKAEYLQRQD